MRHQRVLPCTRSRPKLRTPQLLDFLVFLQAIVSDLFQLHLHGHLLHAPFSASVVMPLLPRVQFLPVILQLFFLQVLLELLVLFFLGVGFKQLLLFVGETFKELLLVLAQLRRMNFVECF